MALRFALIAALCVAQGFAQDPVVQPGEVIGKALEIMGEMGQFGEPGEILANMYNYIQANKPEIVIECLGEQLSNFSSLAEKISGMIRNASDEIIISMGDKYQKFSKEMEVPLKRIASATQALPLKIWEIIKEGEDLKKLLEAMKEYRNIVDESFKMMDKIFAEIAREVPAAAVPIQEMASQIATAARNGFKSIADAFEKCIEDGEQKHHATNTTAKAAA